MTQTSTSGSSADDFYSFHDHDDAAHLHALGYSSEFKRDMSPWANFSLGFTYLSPVVGVYTLFAYALATGGPPMIWSFLLVGVGQLLVALTFSEIVAQFPVAGGVYPWARRLWGRRYAWMTGWVYMVALLVTIASVVYGAGPYIAATLGIDATVNNTIAFALALLALATVINFMGTKVLAKAAIIGFTAEIIGALVVGVWLLVGHRHHNLGVLFDSFGAGGDGTYLWAFAAAALIGIYQYYGFEACGDVAEEVPDPGRLIPKAMRRTIYVGGAAATFVCLALVLAVTDIPGVISGENPDPVSSVLDEAFGPVGSKAILAIVLISFLSCAMSLQAAASRLAYSYGRDGMIMGSSLLKKFSATRHVPPYALVLAAVVPAVIVLGSKFSTDAITKIISFAAFGIYLGFQMVVLAALRARLKGWIPSGKYTLGRWGLAVNVAALVYGVTAMVNMAWPRTPDAPWFDNWIVALSAVVVVGIGLVYMVVHPLHDRSTGPYSDAIPSARR
ncbi:amino acid permease [Mycolicibacterium rufum]|uniref:Amino acid permease n=1 Tax=Mycolicibacterium rufum TaxID=318424 RepID=A0A9X2YB35_9MYCO|nr:amino acid permease [Mycolicibacterium rufum]KGI67460.1 amino acid permease [Mycolicibacterium rufum]MCV7070095.1 amino acid permease [Mycolicibacterium rufum]ULP38410.1 amino acid permease [Mycolicibacterium rufum]